MTKEHFHIMLWGAIGALFLDLARPTGKVDLPVIGSLPTMVPGAGGKGILDGFLKPSGA